MNTLYLEGVSGKLFANLYLPEYVNNPTAWIIVFPAFGDEMNKCRGMVSSQARSLSRAGFAVLVPDLYGTGDSEGDFSDADWSVWCSDMQRLVEWAKGKGAFSISFLGVRLGCLLAADVASSLDFTPDRLVFWQPISDGKQAMTQFLRLRVASTMMSGEKITVADLRSLSSQGTAIEVAGYEIASDLLEAIDQLKLEVLLQSDCDITWIEVVSNKDKPLPLGSRKKIEALQGMGKRIDVTLITGDAFWSTQEITNLPQLIVNTTSIFSKVVSPASGQCDQHYFDHEMRCGIERAVSFSCSGANLLGVLHQPEPAKSRGILLVVGGPQYRIGSHRQFVLISRALAAEGYPVFRFDYRGMGDSEGELKGFEHISQDITAAIDTFYKEVPSIEKVVIWGLCDAASAAAFYSPGDQRVEGLVLLNPWVRSEQGAAKAYLKHYYIKRLFTLSFWDKVLKGKFDVSGSLQSLFTMMVQSRSSGKVCDDNETPVERTKIDSSPVTAGLSSRLFHALKGFKGKVLFVLSENDLTAAEFKESVKQSKPFSRLISESRFTTKHLLQADHTFSKREWRDSVIRFTLVWLASW